MIQIKMWDEVVSESKNLDGIIRYARAHGIYDVVINHTKEEGKNYPVYFVFGDGALSMVEFASIDFAIDFIMARRSWGSYNMHHEPGFVTSFYYR